VLPILLAGAAVSGLLFLGKDLVLPALSRQHLRAERLLNRTDPDRISKVPHLLDPGGARVSMAVYQPVRQRMEATLLTMRAPDGTLTALDWYPVLDWDPATRSWLAERGGTRFPLGAERPGTLRQALPARTAAPLTADVRRVELAVMEGAALGLSRSDTSLLLAAEPENPRLVLLHHGHFTQSLAPVVLLLLSLPFCLRLLSRSAIPSVLAVCGFAALYYAATFLAQGLATGGEVNPVVLAWLPTVVFGSLGLSLYLFMDG
jgi:hypothetical protein